MRLKVLRQIVTMSKFAFYALLLQCIFAGLLLAEDVRSQTTSINDIIVSVKMENVTLRELFKNLEKQTNFNFSYNQGVIDLNEKVSVSSRESLGDLLRYLSKETKLNFKRIDGNIYVSKRKALQASVTETFRSLELIQERTITGTVTSAEDNSALPGVSVLIKGTAAGTVTDIDGKYSLEVAEGSVLLFSYVGFISEEVQVGNQSVIDFVMTPDLTQLEEIVVIGYGAVKKSDLTGSVSSVKSAELTAYPSLGAVQALQGRAAGVQVTANNGEPGASYKVRIRGGTSINASSDPLYVVDGFVGGTLPPPEDIESMEILKDASATAIYGSRGANGVILVTTKRGKPGKAKIEYNGSYSIQHEINRLSLLNADQFVDYMQEFNPNFESRGSDTDWQGQIFQQGIINNHQLSIGGGSDNVNYYISGTYYDQEGLIVGSKYNRLSVTSNIEIKANDKLKFGANIFARRFNKDGVNTQEGSGGTSGTGVIASAFKFEPDLGVYNDDGSFTRATLNDPHDNPYAIATQNTDETLNDRLQSNFFGEYEFIEGLKLRVTVGASTSNERRGRYQPSTTNAGGGAINGIGRIDASKNTDIINENYLTYSRRLGDAHDLTVMAGYSYQKSVNEKWLARSTTFPTDGGLYWNLGGGSVYQQPGSETSEWEVASYYARVNYSLLDRYKLTFTTRYDGSSVFSEGNKWAFFPSGAVAWNLKEEQFLQGVDVLSMAKIRASYGITGNRAIGPYGTLSALTSNLVSVQGGKVVNAVAPLQPANSKLKWETTAQFNIGADISFLEDRIGLIVDYYTMTTSDLLFGASLPEYSGYLNLTPITNFGKVKNSGLEFSIDSKNLVGAFKWDMNFNISANRNEIVELPDDGQDQPYGSGPGHMVGVGSTQILRVGEPVGAFYGWIYDGVYQEGDDFIPGGSFEQEAGGEKFRDIDGTKDDEGELTGQPDGQLNNDDRTILGNPHPDFIWGWNNTFTFKGFDLNVFFQASQGNDIFSYTLMELNLLNGSNNATTDVLNRWTPSNTDTDIPRANGSRSRRSSSRFIYDGSFVRLKNLSLGYNLPASVLDKLKVQKLRLYVSAQNLLTITDYPGYDPEVNYKTNSGANGNKNLGLDYGSYPNAKSVTFGVSLGF
jgi:TonB-linked SusC/RagA family outer membrane protein